MPIVLTNGVVPCVLDANDRLSGSVLHHEAQALAFLVGERSIEVDSVECARLRHRTLHGPGAVLRVHNLRETGIVIQTVGRSSLGHIGRPLIPCIDGSGARAGLIVAGERDSHNLIAIHQTELVLQLVAGVEHHRLRVFGAQ